MNIRPLSPRLQRYLASRGLATTWKKQRALFAVNPRHPGLRTELLEPRHLHLYSFRITRKYRAIFVYCGHETVEVIDINNHYA